MSEGLRDPKTRFSDRVDNYVRYRPHYSKEVVQALQQACGLRSVHVIADVGCGTGLLAEVFLQNGNPVYGIEPNPEMRAAGEAYLSQYANFKMLDGSAEATGLPASSVDFIVAGEAFHWFRPQETRTEFVRILRTGGCVALIWHDRNTEGSPFLRAYEELLRRFSNDYKQVSQRLGITNPVLRDFFAPHAVQVIEQETEQQFDLEGLRGRLLSSSYAPNSGPRCHEMLAELERVFQTHAEDGRVTIPYTTRIYCGQLMP